MQQVPEFSDAITKNTHQDGVQQAMDAPSGETHGIKKNVPDLPREIGGREGPEPTRFGDWEKSGRCVDF